MWRSKGFWNAFLVYVFVIFTLLLTSYNVLPALFPKPEEYNNVMHGIYLVLGFPIFLFIDFENDPFPRIAILQLVNCFIQFSILTYLTKLYDHYMNNR